MTDKEIKRLEYLMDRFAQFPKARVGCGPRHPRTPHPELQEELDAFLDQYPLLKRDTGYVTFLEIYAGADVDTDKGRELESTPDNLLAFFYGFTEITQGIGSHITSEEYGDVVDDEGFLCFAFVQVVREKDIDPGDRYINISFSFDTTGNRPPGVYRNIGLGSLSWYCEDFLTWLDLLVEKRGRLDDASHGAPTSDYALPT